jgi:hypothetical protein
LGIQDLGNVGQMDFDQNSVKDHAHTPY